MMKRTAFLLVAAIGLQRIHTRAGAAAREDVAGAVRYAFGQQPAARGGASR